MSDKPIDYSLYLVLDPVLCQQFGMVETAIEAVKGGATLVQLRAPQWKKKQIYDCALALKKALSGTPAKLIINDHVDVAIAVDADGVPFLVYIDTDAGVDGGQCASLLLTEAHHFRCALPADSGRNGDGLFIFFRFLFPERAEHPADGH